MLHKTNLMQKAFQFQTKKKRSGNMQREKKLNKPPHKYKIAKKKKATKSLHKQSS